MNFAKKMLLVPPETMERLKQASAPSQAMESLSDEMTGVLNKPINDTDKWREYEQLLQRYMAGVSKSKEPIALTLLSDHNDDPILPMQREIVQSVGTNRTLLRKMAFLMNLLGRDQHIQWDERGVVAIGGNIIPGSNIVDLLNDVLRDRKTSAPVGWEPFARLLAFLNVPREFIHNNQRWDYIRRLHGLRGEKRRASDSLEYNSKHRRIQPPEQYFPPNDDDDDDDDDDYGDYDDDSDDDGNMNFDNNGRDLKRKRDDDDDLRGVKRGKVLKPKPNRRVVSRTKGTKRQAHEPLFRYDGYYMLPSKRRRRLLNEGVGYTLRGHKRGAKEPVFKNDTYYTLPSKRRRLLLNEGVNYRLRPRKRKGSTENRVAKRSKRGNVLAENLHDRRQRKRSIVHNNWYDDTKLAVPRKKQKINWASLRLR